MEYKEDEKANLVMSLEIKGDAGLGGQDAGSREEETEEEEWD